MPRGSAVIDRLFAIAQRRPRTVVAGVAALVIGFAFWEPLFAGATLVPTDLAWEHAHPWRAERPFGFVADKASGDLLNIHAHWAMVGRSFRDLSGWWDRSVGLGYPVMKGGFPIFAVPYLVLPAWFAAGVMTVLRTATAWGLTYGWMRSVRLRRASATVAAASFAFSGFVVGWGGWPHANVAAIAPGLLWAVERALADPRPRRGVPIGLAIALMVWANFPLVTAYILIGAVVYAAVRIVTDHGRTALRAALPLTGPVVVAGLVAVGLSYPHLYFFGEWLAWADTSHRHFGVDSSAGPRFLLTAALPGAFGGDGHGPAWWEVGNWVEFEIHVGVPGLLLAGFASAAARGATPSALRRRGVVRALWLLVGLGVVIGYVGGPPTVVAQNLMGDVSGLATRAKVLLSIGFAGLAGFGFEAWIDDRRDAVDARRRLVPFVVVAWGVVVVAFMPSLWRWFGDMTTLGHRRSTAVAALPFVLAGVGALGLLVARGRGRLRSHAFTVGFASVLFAELLIFAKPIPTVADRDERLVATPAHDLVAATLDPGERLATHGVTFFPSTPQLFDIDVLGGQTLKSAGYRALLETVEPTAFSIESGATPTYPSLQPWVDPTLTVWDALGVGVWALDPFTAPPGPRVEPAADAKLTELGSSPAIGTITIPERGLRAVLIDMLIDRADGVVEVALEVGDETITTTIRRDDGWIGVRRPIVVAVAGERLPGGATGTVRVTSSGDPGGVSVGVGPGGALAVGTVGGADDSLRVLSTGPVTLVERLDAAAFRLHDAALVEPDVRAAAALVVDRSSVTGSPVVVEADVGLPTVADPAARLELVAVDVAESHLTVDVDIDRAAVLVFPVADYPGWTATIDGHAAGPAITADAALAAVVVPAGEHTVTLGFAPRGLAKSVGVFAITGLAALALWFGPGFVTRRRRSAA